MFLQFPDVCIVMSTKRKNTFKARGSPKKTRKTASVEVEDQFTVRVQGDACEYTNTNFTDKSTLEPRAIWPVVLLKDAGVVRGTLIFNKTQVNTALNKISPNTCYVISGLFFLSLPFC